MLSTWLGPPSHSEKQWLTRHGTLLIGINLHFLAVEFEAHGAHPGTIMCVLGAPKHSNLVWPFYEEGIHLVVLHHSLTDLRIVMIVGVKGYKFAGKLQQ